MQIEKHVTTTPPFNGRPFYFSSVLFEDWGFWISGPSGYEEKTVREELALYVNLSQALIVQTYVPNVS